MRFSSVLGVLFVHTIVVMRRIVLDKFSVMFSCIVVLFLSFCYCLHVCLCCVLFLAMCSRVDIDPSEEPQY